MLEGQTLNKGNFLVGSTIGFSTADSKVTRESTNVNEKGEGPSAIQFNISPSVGYFVMDYFTIGIGMGYTLSVVEEPNKDKINDSDLLFGPFARYYLPIEDDMAFFGEVNFGFGNSSDQQNVGEGTQGVNSNIFAIGIGPGFTIFSNNGIGIEAIFRYNYARSKFDAELNGVNTVTTTKTNQFDISIGVQFYFGGITRVGG
jgi:hypothetical protein